MKKEIREFIETQLLSTELEFSDCDSLYDLNILTSLNLIQLINFIKTELSIDLQLLDITAEDFENIDVMTQFLQSLKTTA